MINGEIETKDTQLTCSAPEADGPLPNQQID